MPEPSAINGDAADTAPKRVGDLPTDSPPWKARLSRVWWALRKQKSKKATSGSLKILVIVSERTAGEPPAEGLTQSFWGDDDMPSLLGFDVVVLDVPQKQELLTALLPEIAQTTLAGALVIWLLPASEGVSLPREVIDTPSFAQRKPLSASAIQVVDSRFAEYLLAVEEVAILFECPARLQPVAVFGKAAKLCAAAIDESRFPATVVYLPSSRHPRRNAILLATAHGLRTRDTPLRRRRLALQRLVAMTGVLALAVTAARYAQRSANRSLLEFKPQATASTWFLPDRSSEVDLEELTADQWAMLHDLDRSPKAVQALAHDTDVLMALDRLGMTSQADAMLAYVSSAPNSPCDFTWHAGRLRKSAEESLVRGDFEGARYQAQRLLNFVDGLPSCDYFGDANEDLAVAHAVVQLADGNYLYHDREVASALATHALRWTDYGKPFAPPATWDPSLDEDVAYYKTVRATRGLSEGTAIELWRQLAAASPDATRAAEGSFNVILEQVVRHEATDSRDVIVRQNAAGIELCKEFVKRHPDSYLADDAERLRLRMAVTIDDMSQVRDAFTMLATRYKTGDRWKGLAAKLRGAIAKRGKGDKTNDAVWARLVEWITGASQVPFEAALNSLGGDDRALMSELFADYRTKAAVGTAAIPEKTWDASVRLIIHLAREY